MMYILIPLWLIIGISFIMNMSGFVLGWEPALVVQRQIFRKITLSKKERKRLVLCAGVGVFLFSISIAPFFDFLSLTTVHKSVSIQYIIWQFVSWSPFAILFGIAAAFGQSRLIQMLERLNRNS